MKDVLEALSTAYNSPADAPLLLAAPAPTAHGELEQENAIFDALNALVGMANEEAELDNNEESYIQQLRVSYLIYLILYLIFKISIK